MNKKIIYFADLTHTSQTIASEFMPYSVGCVAAYFIEKSRYSEQFDVELFKYPEDLIQAILNRKPFALALSNYMWNSDIANQIAKSTKDIYPNVVNIFGGVNFSEEIHKQEKWLRERPWVDFFIRLEGEIPFTNLIDSILDNNLDLSKTKKLNLNSICSVDEDGDFYSGDTEVRIKDFNDIPSPYIMGLMDKFYETTLWPLVETNRGCPFTCTFCNEGSSYYTKVAKKPDLKITKELTYIAKNHVNQKMMFVADSNFLMFKENIDVCNTLAKLKKAYDWPTFIGSSTGKNRHELVLHGARILNGDISLSASVQHLDDDVLKNIKRSNISIPDILSISTDGKKSGVPTYTEVIASLPGDTLEKYRACLKNLVSSGIDIIRTHTLLILNGTELCTDEDRKKFGLKTKFRATAKSFGTYKFNNKKILSVEEEELVIGTNTLSYSDYLECRRLQVTIQIFYNDDVFHELHCLLKMFGISIWDWMMQCHDNPKTYNKGLKMLIDSYMADVEMELFESSDELRNDFYENSELYISGKRGNNVTFKHKALLFKLYMIDILEYGFKQAEIMLLDENENKYYDYQDYINELKNVNTIRKSDIFNTAIDYGTELWYSIDKYGESNLELNDIKKKTTPVTVNIGHNDEQKVMLDHYFQGHSYDNIIDLAWFLNRVPAHSIYREINIL